MIRARVRARGRDRVRARVRARGRDRVRARVRARGRVPPPQAPASASKGQHYPYF